MVIAWAAAIPLGWGHLEKNDQYAEGQIVYMDDLLPHTLGLMR